jgi:hypothetical protein
MNTQSIRTRIAYVLEADAALTVAATDPRMPNCRGFQVDSSNQVIGIELVVVPMPGTEYALYRAEMFDPYTSGGNPIVKVVVLDAGGVEIGARSVIAWPFPTLGADGSPAGPGNPENNFNISSPFDAAHGVIGPLAFHVIDDRGAIISDVVGGYGQAMGYGHIGGRVTFKQRSASPDPDPDPDPEPDGDALTRIAVAVERLADHLGA